MLEELWLLLQERKISQYRLSKDTGIPQTAISEWKSGRQPNAEKLSVVAAYLGVSVEYLLGKEIEKPAIQKDDGQVETFKKLFMQVSEKDRLEVIQKMLDMLSRK